MKPPTPQRTQRNARKIDQPKVLELAGQGMKPADIAVHQGVARSTITRYLKQQGPGSRACVPVADTRADRLARFHGKTLLTQERIVDSLGVEGFTEGLTVHQKSQLLNALTIAGGTAFDKERLERGESTQNIAVLSKLIEGSDARIYASTSQNTGRSQRRHGRTEYGTQSGGD